MNKNAVLTDFLAQTVGNGRSMAAWFLPDDDELCWISNDAAETITGPGIPDPKNSAGFIFYPFNDSETQPVFLPSSSYSRGFNQMAGNLTGISDIDIALAEKPENLQSTSKDQYIRSLEKIIAKIKSGIAQKVVVSKIKITAGVSKPPSALFLQLKTLYPSAFCWMFYSPESGLWAGATPEVLLTHADGITKTMALAGSRKATAAQSPWPEKEQHEQQLVTDYIVTSLKKLGYDNPEISTPYTVSAGSIEHIRTDISFPHHHMNTSAVVAALHPTPAVCGFPQTTALEIIREYEQHLRAYYTGFLGPVNYNGTSQLYVNLRCAKIWKHHYQLFAGGGITAQSNPQAEWEETELKTQTMLSAIQHAPNL